MLTKIAYKNMSKSIRDYGVYFFTLVFGVCIFYMFNSIYAQQEVMSVTETMNESMVALRQMLSYISVFVAIVLGFLIVFANNFFVRKRKKELGIYLTLGMTKHSVSSILLLETALMATFALAIGLVLGVFLSQFMSVFTAKMFEADLTDYKFIFAPAAAAKSIIYFAIIFIVVALFNTVAIGKFKLIDLIYGGRKNESIKLRNTGISIVVFIISLICLTVAYYLILTNGIIEINVIWTSSVILGVIGTLLFFFSLSGLLTKFIQSNKRVYYKNLNIFTTRQLTGKVNTNFVSISVVCIALLLVIGIFSTGYSMQSALSGDLVNKIRYDFSLYVYNQEEGKSVESIYENLPNQIKNFDGIESYYEHYLRIGEMDTNHYKDYDVDTSSMSFNMESSPLLFLSIFDYNAICEHQNVKEIELLDDEYLVVYPNDTYKNIAQQFVNNKILINVGGVSLKSSGNLLNTSLANDADGIIFVVPDHIADKLRPTKAILNIQCENDKEKQLDELIKIYQENSYSTNSICAFIFYSSRMEIYNSSVTTKALVSFLAIYLGIVFMICSAAILAIQQLSEASDNRERYLLLNKLGAERKMLNKALFTQILCYFLLPLLLAIVHSIIGLFAVNDVVKSFGHVEIAGNIAATAAFVIGVYGLYFGLTYIGSKNIINKN